ncbi:MAG: response regulator, partial [Selenomonadaceae bacterium]|nr:response regulator [Selenomonadaceae bacterium]
VDDIEVNREIVFMIMSEFGFTVDTAVNGQDAYDKVAASKPGDYDLILMDVQMPVMNGYEATKAIRALDNPEIANIPIIAMTANAFSEDIQNAKNAGMNSHIAKPIDVPKMMETLTQFLSK